MRSTEYLKRIAEKHGTIESDLRFTSAFLNGKVSFDMPLDMERCRTQYDYRTYRMPQNRDGEWTYQFSRMEFLHRLVLAYSVTGDEEIVKSYRSFVQSFFLDNDFEHDGEIIDRNGFLKSRLLRCFGKSNLIYPTYRTLDTAIRNYSLLVDRFYLEDQFVDGISERLETDAVKTVERLREFDKFSNWGIIVCALSACTFLMLRCEEKAEKPLAFLKLCLSNQVASDGGHAECSTMYQMHCLMALLRLIYQARQADYQLDPTLEEIARKMARYSFCHCSPTGQMDQYGDSDRLSLNTVFAVSHTLLGIDDVFPLNNDYDVYLLMEFSSLDIGDAPCKPKKPDCRLAFEDSYCYNSQDFCVNLYNGVSTSSHKHADNGQISLWYKGSPYIIDGGRYSYSDLERRSYFRSPSAHSTVIIDDGKSWKEKNPNWFRHVPESDPITCFSGFAIARYQFKGRETVRRFIKPFEGFVVVVDKITCNKKHSYCAQWIVDPGIDVEAVNENSIRIGELYLNSFLPGLKTENANVSEHYNELKTSKKIQLETDFNNEIVNVYSFSKLPQRIGFENGCFYIDNTDVKFDLGVME